MTLEQTCPSLFAEKVNDIEKIWAAGDNSDEKKNDLEWKNRTGEEIS